MRVHKILVLVIMASVVLPAAAAGTEENPELLDDADDVNYHELHSDESPHLDILAAWIEFDLQADVILFRLKTASVMEAEDVPEDFSVTCNWGASLEDDGEPNGRLALNWGKDADADAYRSSVVWVEEAAASTPISPVNVQGIPHELTVLIGQPGYFNWTVERTAVATYGDRLETFSGRCDEAYTPAANVAGYSNWDSAQSEASYDLAALEPAPGNDTDNPLDGRTNNTTPTPEDSATTPNLGVLPVAVILLTAALAARRQLG